MPEHFLCIDPNTGKAAGLLAEIECNASIGERHRTVKVWRALWKRMAAMNFSVMVDADPSKAIANTPPEPRDKVWLRKEVLRLVKFAWRYGFHGLAACMAVAWDSMLSPVDARKLLAGMASGDGAGIVFLVDRAKTGRGAAGTLTQWSEAILMAYLKKQFAGATLLEQTPLFWTRGYQPVSRNGPPGVRGGDRGGGRPTAPRPTASRPSPMTLPPSASWRSVRRRSASCRTCAGQAPSRATPAAVH
jgi:hypothetical protein